MALCKDFTVMAKCWYFRLGRGLRKMAGARAIWRGAEKCGVFKPDGRHHCYLMLRLADTNSNTPCPLRCSGCDLEDPDGDDVLDEVQCEKCRFWSHIKCEDWDDPDIANIIPSTTPLNCRDSFRPNQIIMLPCAGVADWKAAHVLWYPAKFVEHHKKYAGKPNEFQFERLECNDRTVCSSVESILPVQMLRRDLRARKFCSEITEVKLTGKEIQIGNIRLPFYMDSDNPDHANPALTAVSRLWCYMWNQIRTRLGNPDRIRKSRPD
ncbi:hypothetical protein DFH09DRAFT_1078477 [Mycena vulgaris]|nr:hypothetical protein DFH09DRAFT_1078477 [Mycena vulgaris]